MAAIGFKTEVRYIASPTSPIELINGHKPDFDRRPAAPSVRRGLEGYAKYRARNIRKD